MPACCRGVLLRPCNCLVQGRAAEPVHTAARRRRPVCPRRIHPHERDAPPKRAGDPAGAWARLSRCPGVAAECRQCSAPPGLQHRPAQHLLWRPGDASACLDTVRHCHWRSPVQAAVDIAVVMLPAAVKTGSEPQAQRYVPCRHGATASATDFGCRLPARTHWRPSPTISGSWKPLWRRSAASRRLRQTTTPRVKRSPRRCSYW